MRDESEELPPASEEPSPNKAETGFTSEQNLAEGE
jgi:hypothetical protein